MMERLVIQPSDTGSQAVLSSKHGQPRPHVPATSKAAKPHQHTDSGSEKLVWTFCYLEPLHKFVFSHQLSTNFFFPGYYRKPSRYYGYKDDHVEKS